MAEAQLCCLLTWQIRFMLGVGHLCCRLKPAKRLVWKNLFNLWPPGQWGHLPQCQAAISASVWVKVRVRVERIKEITGPGTLRLGKASNDDPSRPQFSCSYIFLIWTTHDDGDLSPSKMSWGWVRVGRTKEPRALGTLGLENTRGLWQGHNSAACSPCRLVSCMAMSTSTLDPSLLIKKRVGN